MPVNGMRTENRKPRKESLLRDEVLQLIHLDRIASAYAMLVRHDLTLDTQILKR
jgi:hypothetical protein